MNRRNVSSDENLKSSFGIICVDGLWGSGKSLLGPIINSFQNVEPFQINYRIEELCHLFYLKEIEKNTMSNMLMREIDLSFYNGLILRNVNFRFHDDSFVVPHLGLVEVVKRLQSRGGFSIYGTDAYVTRKYSFMSHILTAFSSPLVEVFKERIKFLVMNRNPIDMLNHWEKYLEKFDYLGEFTVSQLVGESRVPFFAKNWKEEYLDASVIERAALGISRNMKIQYDYLTKASTKNYTTINFDDLVLNPKKVVNECNAFLSLDHGISHKTRKRLKQLLLIKSFRAIGATEHRKVHSWIESKNLANSKLKKLVSSSLLTEFQSSIDLYFDR